LVFYLKEEVTMGISYNLWAELAEELKPYIARAVSGEITLEQYFEIYDQKYHAFVLKHMAIK
jgi:hypothetical protein